MIQCFLVISLIIWNFQRPFEQDGGFMIIQTGNRTDIPAFYSDWFANRLKEGYVFVRNPFNPQNVTRYTLDPAVTDLIVFCTKNPGPFLKYMPLTKPYHQYWFVTITSYGRDIEPNVPDKDTVIRTFRELSSLVGAGNMCWRYDPIILDVSGSDTAFPPTFQASHTGWTIERHIDSFRSMCEALAGYTHTAVISFIDLYEKVKRNFPEVTAVPLKVQLQLTEAFVKIAKEYDMIIKPCGESKLLESVGADCSGCMTQKVFEAAVGQNLILPPNPNNRRECACYITGDIGAYNSCGHLCRYCYANFNKAAVTEAMRQHDPNSPLLIGHIMPEDRISEPRQVSWVYPQMRLENLF